MKERAEGNAKHCSLCPKATSMEWQLHDTLPPLALSHESGRCVHVQSSHLIQEPKCALPSTRDLTGLKGVGGGAVAG